MRVPQAADAQTGLWMWHLKISCTCKRILPARESVSFNLHSSRRVLDPPKRVSASPRKKNNQYIHDFLLANFLIPFSSIINIRTPMKWSSINIDTIADYPSNQNHLSYLQRIKKSIIWIIEKYNWKYIISEYKLTNKFFNLTLSTFSSEFITTLNNLC